MILNILSGLRKLAVSPVIQTSVRNYAVPKRKLVRKPDFVYTQSMKSRYKANPHPRLNVLLLQDVKDVGMKDEVVQVKRGRGRNDLIPNKLAIYATPENLLKRGMDPSILKTGGNKVPGNVVNYLRKNVVKLYAPYADDDFFISRHDIAEYFLRHSNLYVPIYCMHIREAENEVISELGSYTLEITINNLLTVPIPLEVHRRERLTEEN